MENYSFVGIDMAKEKFDVAILPEEKLILKVFPNTQDGFQDFHQWLNQYTSHAWVCLEATGHYSELLAEFLFEQKIKVSVVNPMRIAQFRKLNLGRNKNDTVDARLIREFTEQYKPRIFQPRSREQKALRELIQLIDLLTEQKVQLTNQWQTLQMVEVKKEVKKLIQGLEKKIAALHEKMHALSQKQGSLSEPIQ